jgi:hypothetical protein
MSAPPQSRTIFANTVCRDPTMQKKTLLVIIEASRFMNNATDMLSTTHVDLKRACLKQSS